MQKELRGPDPWIPAAHSRPAQTSRLEGQANLSSLRDVSAASAAKLVYFRPLGLHISPADLGGVEPRKNRCCSLHHLRWKQTNREVEETLSASLIFNGIIMFFTKLGAVLLGAGSCCFSPHLCVGFFFLVRPLLRPLLPSSSSTVSHTIFHTQLCHTHTQLSHTHTTLSHTHAQLCYTQLYHTHNFVTHNFVTHHLSHTHNLSHTTLSRGTLSHQLQKWNRVAMVHFLSEIVWYEWHNTISSVQLEWKTLTLTYPVFAMP